MVNKIIADYLKTSKRLVVPQFGAFIRKEDSGTIAFVPFLKKDDGVLTQLLCSAYGLTPNDAQTVINAFVEEVKESVSTRGVYIIEGVGNITTDPNGYSADGIRSTPATGGSTIEGCARRAQANRTGNCTPNGNGASDIVRNTIRVACRQSTCESNGSSGSI